MKNLVYGTLLVFLMISAFCQAAPEPAIVPGLAQWTLDVRFQVPRQIVLTRKADKKPARFWYTILTITNTAGHDVDFYSRCELMTDTFEIIPAGRDVPPVVFEQIKKRHKRKYPFLESLENTSSKILQGEDNTKDIAIIWSDFDAGAKNIKLFITGLSNETAVIDHPTVTNAAGRPLMVFLRKTLELSYKLRSDPIFRASTKLTQKSKRWIMR